jgi:hypothetical protein
MTVISMARLQKAVIEKTQMKRKSMRKASLNGEKWDWVKGKKGGISLHSSSAGVF